MKEMNIRAATCDVCLTHKLCWHVSLADICATCLATGSDVITEIEGFKFINMEKPKATAKR